MGTPLLSNSEAKVCQSEWRFGPTERFHKMNDGAHVTGGESHAGEIGASEILAIRLEAPGRKVLVSHRGGLTDNSL